MAMTPEKRSTSILRSTLLISERLLASAQAVDESSAQLRYGQEWKAWVQLEKAGLSLTGVEQMQRRGLADVADAEKLLLVHHLGNAVPVDGEYIHL